MSQAQLDFDAPAPTSDPEPDAVGPPPTSDGAAWEGAAPDPAPAADRAKTLGPPRLRPLPVTEDPRVPLYVQATHGSVKLDDEVLRVRVEGEDHAEVRLSNTSHVCLIGHVQISTQAMHALLRAGIPVTYFASSGWFLGRAAGLDSNKIALRLAQYDASQRPGRCAHLARALVASKIRNGRTLLRRNGDGVPAETLDDLERLARSARNAGSLESLRGIEGAAARAYFAAFPRMLRDEADPPAFPWRGRHRRPAPDPLNAMISFAYGLLTKDYALALHAVGLDPMLGFYHQPRFGRPALALDLMEELRPVLADSTVLTVVNNGMIAPDDFARADDGACTLRPKARRAFIQAYERRVTQTTTHPLTGQKLRYREVLEVQARLLARWLEGELDTYPELGIR